MESYKSCTSAGKPWSKSEDNQLIKEYNEDKLSLLDIYKNHKRTPGAITARLVRLNIIDRRDSIRGYLEYENSDLYKELCKNKEYKYSEAKNNQPLITSSFGSLKNSSDILQLQKDVNEIKEKVNNILELMHMIYEFETE